MGAMECGRALDPSAQQKAAWTVATLAVLGYLQQDSR